MITRIIAVAAILALPTFAVMDGGNTAPAPIEVGLRVGPTDFYARNYSGTPQVLFFRAGETMTWRVLQPGGEFASTYPRQALDGVELEVAKYVDGQWHTSHSFDLSALCDTGADALWIQDGAALASWLQVGNALTLFGATPSFLPDALQSASTSPEEPPPLEPLHVPVITPTETPTGDCPPVLGDRPLPPM
jgi:hypothetical protein